MQTNQLYYDDPYLQSCTSKIVDARTDETGRFYIVLSETVFYPEGGGQPSDQGWVNDKVVTDVQKVDGTIRHYLSDHHTELQKGADVTCRLNWERRFDHMQQHAAQHLLTAILEDQFQIKTHAFHLGAAEATIDLETESISESILQECETVINQRIVQNLPIYTKWVKEQEAALLSLRKPPSVQGMIRLVIIDGVDSNACGGTHPKFTAEIGSIKLMKWKRHKKGVQLTFIGGKRATEMFYKEHLVLQQLGTQLSKPVLDIADGVEVLLEKQQIMEGKLREYEDEMISLMAENLTSECQMDSGVLIKHFESHSIPFLQKLIQKLANQNSHSFLLFTTDQNSQTRILIAKGKEQSGSASLALNTILSQFNGKGGGQTHYAQGNILQQESKIKLEETFIAYLEKRNSHEAF